MEADSRDGTVLSVPILTNRALLSAPCVELPEGRPPGRQGEAGGTDRRKDGCDIPDTPTSPVSRMRHSVVFEVCSRVRVRR